jgi:hypothetical protein
MKAVSAGICSKGGGCIGGGGGACVGGEGGAGDGGGDIVNVKPLALSMHARW